MLVAAEDEAARVGLTGGLRYVIGTEVPVPGGADHEIDAARPDLRGVGAGHPRPAPRGVRAGRAAGRSGRR